MTHKVTYTDCDIIPKKQIKEGNSTCTIVVSRPVKNYFCLPRLMLTRNSNRMSDHTADGSENGLTN